MYQRRTLSSLYPNLSSGIGSIFLLFNTHTTNQVTTVYKTLEQFSSIQIKFQHLLKRTRHLLSASAHTNCFNCETYLAKQRLWLKNKTISDPSYFHTPGTFLIKQIPTRPRTLPLFLPNPIQRHSKTSTNSTIFKTTTTTTTWPISDPSGVISADPRPGRERESAEAQTDRSIHEGTHRTDNDDACDH